MADKRLWTVLPPVTCGPSEGVLDVSAIRGRGDPAQVSVGSKSSRWRWWRGSGFLGVGVASCVVLAGCGVGLGGGNLTRQDGPLRLGGDDGDVCMLPSTDGQFTFALDVVENSTRDEIRIDSIALVGATNASMVGGYVAPYENTTVIGVHRSWPPDHPLPTFEQKRATPAKIASGAFENVIVHLSAVAPAQVESIEVTYTRNGREMRVRNSTAIRVRDDCT